MKTTLAIIFSFCMLYPSYLKSQEMLSQGNKWYVRSLDGFSGGSSTTIYKIEGEKVIGGKEYVVVKKAYARDTNYYQETGFFLRKDSSGKIFSKFHSDDEVLLYDFSKLVGDTVSFPITGQGNYCNFIVESIDTIILNNDVQKKRFFLTNLDYRYEDSYYIEGIGSGVGLVDPGGGVCVFDVNYFLACVFMDDKPVWGGGNCFRVPVDETILENDVKIFPNPFLNELVIETPNSTTERIEIFSGDGSLVLNSRKSSSNTKVDTHLLKPGFYIVKVTERNGRTTSHKILKIKS